MSDPLKPPVVRIHWRNKNGGFYTFGYMCRKLADGKVLIAFTTHFGNQPARIEYIRYSSDGGAGWDLDFERPVLRPDKALDVSFVVAEASVCDLADPLPLGSLPLTRGTTAYAYSFAEYAEPLRFNDARHLFTPTHDRELAEQMTASPLRLASLEPHGGEMRGTPVWSEAGNLLGLVYEEVELPIGKRLVLVRASKLRELLQRLGH